MKKLTTLSLMLWHLFAFATHGSLMTDQEEAQALAENASTKEALQKAYSDYMGYLNQYRDGSLKYEVLGMAYQKETMALFDAIMQAIQNDTSGELAPIASDYDEAHQKDYQSHLYKLIGIAQSILKIPAYGCFLPPDPHYPNLLSNGDFSQGTSNWALTGGNAKLVVNPPGTIDSNSPVANLGSLTLTDVPTHPGYASVSQTVQTTPGNTYLISGYVLGTPPASEGAYAGGIDVSGARFLKSSISGKTTTFPQVSNEIDQGGLHRIYYWLIADGDAMTFSGTPDPSGYEPTLALWTYGESQRGPNHPLTHTNAPGADPITEFDCEMGTDLTPNTPPPAGKVGVRDGSYIGHAFGGHSEYIDTNADGTEEWKIVPDFWDGKPHILEMKGNYQSDGRLILVRLLDGVIFSTQDLGIGPFSPMYIKIATENPNWNSRAHIKGQAEVVIHAVDIQVFPQKGLSLPVDIIDYTWFTPGGGGAISYCPFPRTML